MCSAYEFCLFILVSIDTETFWIWCNSHWNTDFMTFIIVIIIIMYLFCKNFKSKKNCVNVNLFVRNYEWRLLFMWCIKTIERNCKSDCDVSSWIQSDFNISKYLWDCHNFDSNKAMTNTEKVKRKTRCEHNIQITTPMIAIGKRNCLSLWS